MFGSGEGKGGLGGSGKDKEVGNKMELGKEEKIPKGASTEHGQASG